MIINCLTVDEHDRICLEDILNHSWLKDQTELDLFINLENLWSVQNFWNTNEHISTEAIIYTSSSMDSIRTSTTIETSSICSETSTSTIEIEVFKEKLKRNSFLEPIKKIKKKISSLYSIIKRFAQYSFRNVISIFKKY